MGFNWLTPFVSNDISRAMTFGISDKLGLTKDPYENIPMPKVEKAAPAPTKESGGNPLDLLHRRRRAGRASTVKTGDLIPTNIGYRSLLG